MALNQYTQLLIFIKSLGENDDYINTITKGGDNIDLNKIDIYPLLNIDVLTGGFSNGQTINFEVSLQCLDIRDINKEVTSDRFWEQDNEVDNHNETLAALNRIWGLMYKNFCDNNITSSENPSFEKITFASKNLLDGWDLTFTVEMPNTTIDLCNECP